MSSPLQDNIANLQSILDIINNLPEAGSGSSGEESLPAAEGELF